MSRNGDANWSAADGYSVADIYTTELSSPLREEGTDEFHQSRLVVIPDHAGIEGRPTPEGGERMGLYLLGLKQDLLVSTGTVEPDLRTRNRGIESPTRT